MVDILEGATFGSHMTQVDLLGYDLHLSKAHTHTRYRQEKNKKPSPAEEEPKRLQTTGKGEMVSRKQTMPQRRKHLD